jgi:hypothetical protein
MVMLANDHTTCTKKSQQVVIRWLPRAPSNETSLTARELVARLEVVDPRFDVSTYGLFLKDIPKRLGESKVLDASTSVFLTCLTAIHAPSKHQLALEQYGNALGSLRATLADPELKPSLDTLLSIYMIMVSEVCHHHSLQWPQQSDEREGHHGKDGWARLRATWTSPHGTH